MSFIKILRNLTLQNNSLKRSLSTSKIVQNRGFLVEDNNNGIRNLFFNRQEKKNAMSLDMFAGMRDAVNDASNNPKINFIVLSGKGEFFSAGNDVKNFFFEEHECVPEGVKRNKEIIKSFMLAFVDCKKPIIALVNGPAIGIGSTILPICDLSLSVDDAYFSTPFCKLGIIPEAGSTFLFPKIMGYARANSMIMFGRKLSAKEALESNLISEIIPREKFAEETSKRIEEILDMPIKSLLYTKELIRGKERSILHKVISEEWDILEERIPSEDSQNAYIKFLARKAANKK